MDEPEAEPEYLGDDETHGRACHSRWMERRNRKIEQEYANQDWYYEQCLRCRYFIPLTGYLVGDWGACSNAKSSFDGRVMFEHDGCEEFDSAYD